MGFRTRAWMGFLRFTRLVYRLEREQADRPARGSLPGARALCRAGPDALRVATQPERQPQQDDPLARIIHECRLCVVGSPSPYPRPLDGGEGRGEAGVSVHA